MRGVDTSAYPLSADEDHRPVQKYCLPPHDDPGVTPPPRRPTAGLLMATTGEGAQGGRGRTSQGASPLEHHQQQQSRWPHHLHPQLPTFLELLHQQQSRRQPWMKEAPLRKQPVDALLPGPGDDEGAGAGADDGCTRERAPGHRVTCWQQATLRLSPSSPRASYDTPRDLGYSRRQRKCRATRP